MSASIVGIDDRNRRQLEQQLAGWWSAVLGMPAIDRDDDLFAAGCDPERGSMVLDRIRRELQIDIHISDLFEARSISKLADLIEIRQSSMDAVSIIPIRRGGWKKPLFLVHGVGGNVLGFVNLVRSLDPEQPVYGIQAQALQSTGPTLIRLEDMAAYYLAELRAVQPTGPYAFLGLSFGGLVAYEMAQQLAASGESVRLVGMLDTWQPGYMRQVRTAALFPKRVMDRLRLVWLNTSKLTLRQTMRYVLGRLKGRMLRVLYGRMGTSGGGVSLPRSMRRVRDINLMAGSRYTVRGYPGRITLFRALAGDSTVLPDDLGWRSYAQGGVDLVRLPGDHGQVLAEPNVSFLAQALTERLEAPAAAVNPVAARTEFELEHGVLPQSASAPGARGRSPAEPSLNTCAVSQERTPGGSRLLVDHLTAIPERWAAEFARGHKHTRKAAE